jgi:hypothetical protein
MLKYIVYNLTTYFSQQPRNIKCCPVCGKSISSSDIPPSKAVTRSLELGKDYLPAHYFSYLYTCQTCPWWGIRESWAFHETSGTNDYLVVELEDKLERTNPQIPPWKQIVDDLNLYKRVQPLPDDLGKLFLGGESYASLESRGRSLWNDVQQFAADYARSKTKKK